MNARVQPPAADTADREIVQTRVYDAPRELVFAAFTDPRHVGKWWGPHGFATTTHTHALAPGGEWRFTLHGPDGTDYENRIVYREVERPARLVYEHADPADGQPPFHVVVSFEERGAGGTALTLRTILATAAERARVVGFGAVEGGQQTLARLADHVALYDGAAPGEAFELERVFDAPRELVYRVWTTPEHMARWWGPTGLEVGVARMDLRPGGTFHYSMRAPGGPEMWGKFVYRDITPGARIVWINSFSDPEGGVTRHPGAPEWPAEMLGEVLFLDEGGKTRIKIRSIPWNATPEERRTFVAGHASMQAGFGGTFDQLRDYLASL